LLIDPDEIKITFVTPTRKEDPPPINVTPTNPYSIIDPVRHHAPHQVAVGFCRFLAGFSVFADRAGHCSNDQIFAHVYDHSS
jgi:hypothetical protein